MKVARLILELKNVLLFFNRTNYKCAPISLASLQVPSRTTDETKELAHETELSKMRFLVGLYGGYCTLAPDFAGMVRHQYGN